MKRANRARLYPKTVITVCSLLVQKGIQSCVLEGRRCQTNAAQCLSPQEKQREVWEEAQPAQVRAGCEVSDSALCASDSLFAHPAAINTFIRHILRAMHFPEHFAHFSVICEMHSLPLFNWPGSQVSKSGRTFSRVLPKEVPEPRFWARPAWREITSLTYSMASTRWRFNKSGLAVHFED